MYVCRSTVTVPRGTSKLLLTFSQEVALGMNYLADKGFTHGNLMAMNVMVSRENECKVSSKCCQMGDISVIVYKPS